MKANVILFFFFILIFANKAYALEGFPNCAYLGIGGGANLYNGHGEFNLAIGYDRIFEAASPHITVGILAEGAFSSHNALLLGLPIGAYASDHLKFWITPTYVYSGVEKHAEPGEEHFEYGDQFMLTFGGGYAIPLNNTNFSFIPYITGSLLNYEFILSAGIKFGINFTDGR